MLPLNRYCAGLALSLALFAGQAAGQNSLNGASITGKPYMPTEAECLEAIKSGRLLGTDRDGRLILMQGDVMFWVFISPAYIDCETVAFPEKQ